LAGVALPAAGFAAVGRLAGFAAAALPLPGLAGFVAAGLRGADALAGAGLAGRVDFAAAARAAGLRAVALAGRGEAARAGLFLPPAAGVLREARGFDAISERPDPILKKRGIIHTAARG
jgi:hypothetical protein